jgi:hypothetical protein
MTVKDYLLRIRAQEYTLRSVEQELSRLDYEAFHLKSTKIGEKIQTSHQADLSEIVEKLESYRQIVNEEWDKLIDMRIEARGLINHLTDEAEKGLILRRYLQCETWDAISHEMHMALRTVFRVHGQALQNLDPIFQKYWQ